MTACFFAAIHGKMSKLVNIIKTNIEHSPEVYAQLLLKPKPGSNVFQLKMKKPKKRRLLS
jgi:hypothetical protein